MSADGPRLLLAILERPDDDSVRLIYADWLEEQGEADRAAFVRLQLAISKAGLVREDDEGVLRAAALLHSHLAEWVPASLLNPPGRGMSLSATCLTFDEPTDGVGRLTRAHFRRGFIDWLEAGVSVFQRAAAVGLFREAPIRHVRINDVFPLRVAGAPVPHRYFGAGLVPEHLEARMGGAMSSYVVPAPVYARLSAPEVTGDDFGGRGYASRAEATQDLAAACVRWGRDEAGLPPLSGSPATAS